MLNRTVVVLILLTCLITLASAASVVHAGEPIADLLLIYDERRPLLLDADYVSAMTNLLGHFDLKVKTMAVDNYHAGDIRKYRYVIYMGNGTKDLPESFMDEVGTTSIPVMWIDGGIEQLIASRPGLGWELKSKSFALAQILYRGRQIPNGRTQLLNCLRVDDGSKVWAWAIAGKQKNPLVVSKGSIWYVGRLDFWRGHYPVVADLLHDFLGMEHEGRQQAFVRIEDVHPKRDPNQIKSIADYFWEQKIPFMLAVIPVYVNPRSGEVLLMSQAPEMVAALRYAVDKGGSIILHGYTHQFGNSETGIGFEFWDDELDRPLAVNRPSYVRDRIERGVEELDKVGLRPLAFEPPHYAMSSVGYLTAAHHFSTIVGAVQLGDQTRKVNQSFPYVIFHDSYGFKIIPENLGYLDPSAANAVQLALARAERLKVVRDATVGVFVHPFVGIPILAAMMDGLREQGYSFYDPKQDVHWVATKNISYQVGSPAPVSPSEPSPDGKPTLFHQLGITILSVMLSIWIVWSLLRANERKMAG